MPSVGILGRGMISRGGRGCGAKIASHLGAICSPGRRIIKLFKAIFHRKLKT